MSLTLDILFKDEALIFINKPRYLAICEGSLAERQTVDAPRARVGAIKFAVREGGKTAITHVHPFTSSRTAAIWAMARRGARRCCR